MWFSWQILAIYVDNQTIPLEKKLLKCQNGEHGNWTQDLLVSKRHPNHHAMWIIVTYDSVYLYIYKDTKQLCT
jgi:hypothetical protein